MPRWSEWIRLEDGTTAIVCGSGPRPRAKPCKCGARSTKLCDYPIGGRKTCDAPLCDRCAVSMGRNRDWCPDHSQERP
jgi:hypothetical protein